MSLNLAKKITVYFKANQLAEGESFLFEVDQADLPYGVFGKDCVEVARIVSPEHNTGRWDAVPYRRRESNGELVPATVDVRKELYDILKTVPPTIAEDGSIKFGDRDANDLFPRVTGVAVQDSNVAQRVAQLFEERGYELTKAYR